MSWEFETGDYVTLGSNAALDLPNGDWTIAGWFRLHNGNGGSATKTIFRRYNASAPNQNVAVNVYESGSGSPNTILAQYTDDNGDYEAVAGSATPGSDTDWHHVVYQRDGATYRLFVDGGADGTTPVSTVAQTAAVDATFSRSDVAVYQFEGRLHQWAKWNRALSGGEITNLYTLASVPSDLSPIWYCPTTDFTESIVPLTVTNAGASISADSPATPDTSSTILLPTLQVTI